MLQIFALLLQIFALLLQIFALLFEIKCTEIDQLQSSNIFMYVIIHVNLYSSQETKFLREGEVSKTPFTRPLSPVYTRIRPVRGSQIRPVPWFSCVYTAERDEFQHGSKFVRYRVNGV